MLLRLLLLTLLFTSACSSLPKEKLKTEPEILPPVTLRVNPKICARSCTVSVQWRITPHPDNREFSIIIWEGDDALKLNRFQVSEHTESLIGKFDKAVFPPLYINVESGVYIIEIQIKRITADGQEQLLNVIEKLQVQ